MFILSLILPVYLVEVLLLSNILFHTVQSRKMRIISKFSFYFVNFKILISHSYVKTRIHLRQAHQFTADEFLTPCVKVKAQRLLSDCSCKIKYLHVSKIVYLFVLYLAIVFDNCIFQLFFVFYFLFLFN